MFIPLVATDGAANVPILAVEAADVTGGFTAAVLARLGINVPLAQRAPGEVVGHGHVARSLMLADAQRSKAAGLQLLWLCRACVEALSLVQKEA